MKITDEQVEKVCEHAYGAFFFEDDVLKAHRRRVIRAALEVAFPDPLGFCAKTLNCRLGAGHKGGCVR